MAFISVLGMAAACLTTAAFVPQAVKTLRTRSTAGLSVNTFILLFAGTVCWLIYGILIGNLPVMLVNAVAALVTGIIIILFMIVTLRKK